MREEVSPPEKEPQLEQPSNDSIPDSYPLPIT